MNKSLKALETGLIYIFTSWRYSNWLKSLLVLVVVVQTVNLLAPVSLTPKVKSKVVTASNGLPLREFPDTHGVWRYPRELNQISPQYIEVLLNYEDRYFYQHFGVNPLSLIRAAWQWVKNGRVISGGSTITMQVARLVRPTDRTVWGKVLQLLTALQLEWNYDKSQILTYYINHAPFGGRVEGVEAASMFYFGYSAEELTYAQAALLAVLPQSPSKNRPDRNPDRAERARNKVLKRMLDYEVISAEEYQYSLMETVEVIEQKMPVLAPLLSRKLAKSSNAVVIQTTINYDKQLAATETVKSYVQGLGDKVTAAVLVVDNQSSEVIVHIGSADFYDNNRFAHVNMVQAQRSPGSTLKPFIYGMALDKGVIHSHSLLMDVPLKFEQYQPENFNDKFSGPVTAQFALAASLNVPAVQLLEQISPNEFFISMLNSGVQLNLPKWAQPNLSIALGGLSVNLETLVKAYVALANKGQTKPLRYTANQQSLLVGVTAEPLPILSASAAWVVSEMLKSTSSNGTTNELSRLGYAVKTGTSASHSDVLAIAVGSQYTIGVWIGRPDNGSMGGHQGSYTAVPLLYQIAGILDTNTYNNSGAIAKPDNVEQRQICWPAGNQETNQCLQSHNAWVIDQNIPKTIMNTKGQAGAIELNELQVKVAKDTGLRLSSGCDLTASRHTIALWPEQLTDWLPVEWQNQTRIPKIDPRCSKPDTVNQSQKIQIVGVEAEQVFQSIDDESLPNLKLKALNPSGTYYWYVNGKLQSIESKDLELELKPDFYQVTLSDQLGKVAKVSFLVR